MDGVGRHGGDVSALELLTVELNVLFCKGEIGRCSGLETKRQRLRWDGIYITTSRQCLRTGVVVVSAKAGRCITSGSSVELLHMDGQTESASRSDTTTEISNRRVPVGQQSVLPRTTDRRPRFRQLIVVTDRAVHGARY